MNFLNSANLQSAIFERLSEDSDVTALVGEHIYDAMPSGVSPDLFISLGAETMIDRSDGTGGGSEHDITLSIVTEKTGFLQAKQVAHAVGKALLAGPPKLSEGRIVYLNFLRATAQRDTDSHTRRIDMIFRLRVDLN